MFSEQRFAILVMLFIIVHPFSYYSYFSSSSLLHPMYAYFCNYALVFTGVVWWWMVISFLDWCLLMLANNNLCWLMLTWSDWLCLVVRDPYIVSAVTLTRGQPWITSGKWAPAAFSLGLANTKLSSCKFLLSECHFHYQAPLYGIYCYY